MPTNRLDQFEAIFHPKSIAIVGASEDQRKMSTLFLNGLISAGFKGKLFPVNPRGGESLGIEIHRDIRSIPEPVDYAIISVPAHSIPDVLDDCAAHGVKAVHIFSAGFSESGEDHGRTLEDEIVQQAARGGFRIIGPNCIGVHCPASRVPLYNMIHLGNPGKIAFLSQSGGHAERLCYTALRRDIRFSKVVSFGNGCDLNELDFLEHFHDDPDTEIVCGYLEGTKDGQRLYQLIKQLASTKPMVIWKGGQSAAGVETAFSHTASLAGARNVWNAALRQAGAVEVNSIEELADTLLAFQNLPPTARRRVVITAITAGSGGISVASADVCEDMGLELATITSKTKERLKELVPAAGSILRNPLDVSVAGGNPEMLKGILQAVDADPATDFIIVYLNVDAALRYYWQDEGLTPIESVFTDFNRTSAKPLLVILHPTFNQTELAEMESNLCRSGIAVYPTVERACKAILNVTAYWKFREELVESGEGK